MMKMNFNNWREFLAEAKAQPDTLLREISEDEMEHITAALDEMSPESWAFNELFEGKNRVIIDFPTLDPSSDLGGFLLLFQNMGYDVDWSKGILSGEKIFRDTSPAGFVDGLLTGRWETGKTKKIKMKVGKFLATIYRMAKKNYEIWLELSRKDPNGRVTGNDILKHLGEEGAQRYYLTNDQLNMYLGNESQKGSAPEFWKKKAQYWQQNADYIKNNLDNAETDQYSIIITRHPIDVLRMSDFNNIQSCHSPPSRGGEGSYYKCAVAEAHGHGAVAYVVNTAELLEQTDSSDIGEAEGVIQEGEVFDDEIRGSHVGMGILPLSRVRLRQMRYYEEENPKRWDAGVELAVPENRIYGDNIPGLKDRVTKWAQTNQEKQIKNAPKTDSGKYNLSLFYKFGGSYEDSGRADIVAALFNVKREELTGHLKQHTETEDNLDVNLVGGVMEQYSQQCEEIADGWNYRYQGAEVEYEVEDDGAGSVYITIGASMTIKWSLDEWSRFPNQNEVEWALGELRDIGWGFIKDSYPTFLKKPGIGDVEVHLTFGIEPEHLPDFGGQAYAYDPDMFEDFCVEINKVDDAYDAIKGELERFFKRNGDMQGGAFIQMNYDIEQKDISAYEWEIENDNKWDPEDATEIIASTTHYFDPEEYGMDPRVMFQVLDSREYRLAVRTAILAGPREEVGTEYYLDVDSSVVEHAGELKYTLQFKVYEHHPDILIDLLKAVIEDMDDEDVLNSIFTTTFKQAQNSRLPSGMQKELNETGHVVKRWKQFLRG